MPSESFTPGPWTVVPHHSWSIAAGPQNVATTHSSRFDKEVRAANARLIAAAPDLYEALSLLVKDVADYEAWQRPCHALDFAREALAKVGVNPAHSRDGD